jgi:hypothetical protein
MTSAGQHLAGRSRQPGSACSGNVGGTRVQGVLCAQIVTHPGGSPGRCHALGERRWQGPRGKTQWRGCIRCRRLPSGRTCPDSDARGGISRDRPRTGSSGREEAARSQPAWGPGSVSAETAVRSRPSGGTGASVHRQCEGPRHVDSHLVSGDRPCGTVAPIGVAPDYP